MRGLFVTLLCVLICQAAHARIWRVEQDGSGDFDNLWIAGQSVASGDTIMIGAGLYNDWEVTGNPPGEVMARMRIDQEELTIIGAGDDQTIIGPEEPWVVENGWHVGILSWPTNFELRIEGICFRNLWNGFDGYGEGTVVVSDCLFLDNFTGTKFRDDHSELIDCTFDGVARDGDHVKSYFQSTFVMKGCVLRHEGDSPWNNGIMQFEGPCNSRIEGCEFYGTATGMILSRGAQVVVASSLFDGQKKQCFFFGDSVLLTVNDCSFVNQEIVVMDVYSSGEIRFQGTSVFDNADSFMWCYSLPATGYVRDCLLAKGERGVIFNTRNPTKDLKEDFKGLVHFDMTNNWWGTAEEDSILAWIDDNRNDPDIPYIIDYKPFKGEPVSTEKKSLGTLKALFR